MKKIGFVLVGLLVMGLATNLAVAKTTRYTYQNWVHIQEYYGWGPAKYYGEDVKVVYTATNSWTVNQEPETVDVEGATLRQNLQQKGTAKIYSIATGQLLDTRPFVCHELDIDENIDAGSWVGSWYVAWGRDMSKLERVHYEWKIVGVYHFRWEVRDGVIVSTRIWFRPPKPNGS